MLYPHPLTSTQWPLDVSMTHRLNEKQNLGPCVYPERQVWGCSQEVPEGTASSREGEALDLKTITHRCSHKCDSYVTRQCGHHLPPGDLLEAIYLSESSGLTKMWCECPQWSPPACIPLGPSPSISGVPLKSLQPQPLPDHQFLPISLWGSQDSGSCCLTRVSSRLTSEAGRCLRCSHPGTACLAASVS